jgi:hypothetical protein
MERDMTPDEMARFEEDEVQRDGERNRGDAGPASEQDEDWSPEQPVTTPTVVPNPD